MSVRTAEAPLVFIRSLGTGTTPKVSRFGEGLSDHVLAELADFMDELEAQQQPAVKDLPARAELLHHVLEASAASRAQSGDDSSTAFAVQGRSPREASIYLADNHLEFYAYPMVLNIAKVKVLSTWVGTKMTRHMTAFIVSWSIALLLVTLLTPFAEFVPREGPIRLPNEGDTKVELWVVRKGLFTWVLDDVGYPVLWFLMLHHLNRDLFVKVLFTFESLMILGSFVISEFALMFNMLSVWRPLGYYDSTWMVADILRIFLVVLPCGVAICTVDSWKVTSATRGSGRSKLKLLLLLLATVYFLFSFASTYRGMGRLKWLDRMSSLGMISMVPRALFRSAEIQKIIFLVKAMFKYATGCPFATVRPIFMNKMCFEDATRQSAMSWSGSSSGLSEGSDSGDAASDA